MNYSNIINVLSNYVTIERINIFKRVLNNRIATIHVLLEDVYQSHNASAILRSCDAFGFQYVYVLEKNNTFQPNKEISLGSEKWLTITKYKYNIVNEIINDFKNNGFKIIATALSDDSISLKDLSFYTEKLVIMFGTEKYGISDELLSLADYKLKIPLYGFVDSINVSVATGIILQFLSERIRKSNFDFHLSQQEKDKILAEWLIKTVPFSTEILKRYSLFPNSLSK